MYELLGCMLNGNVTVIKSAPSAPRSVCLFLCVHACEKTWWHTLEAHCKSTARAADSWTLTDTHKHKHPRLNLFLEAVYFPGVYI